MRFKSDVLPLLQFYLLLDLQLVPALNCDKTFTYYEEYGQNSFNVTCSGITKGYEHILENITINNEISLTVSDSVLENITSNIFKNVKNIKILHIFNSTFEFDKKLAIFNKLEKLETLIIQDSPFEVENVTLRGLANLKRLELYNNSLSLIEPGGFKDLMSLEKLELVNNHIKSLEDLHLCELKKLKTLNLKQNLLSSLKSFHFFCLKSTKSLDFNINSMPSLPNVYHSAYYNINTMGYDLLDLDLSFNQIVEVGYSLENLGKLRNLNLGYNKLTSVKYIYFKSLARLKKLMINNNELRTTDSRIFANASQLNLVDFSYNLLTSLMVADAPQLQYLDISHNQVYSIFLKNLKRLKSVDLSFNKLKKLETGSFKQVPSLVNLNLASNTLNLTLGLFQNLGGLRYLCLSNNSLNNITEMVFLGLKYLRELDLSFNNLKSFNANTFHDLENLETLNLSSNSIKSLSYLMIEPLKNLRTLDIAANKLTYIEYDVILSTLPGLSNINIKSNQLTCENLGKIITFLKQRHIVYTNSENMDYGKLNQNVAGIPCRSASATANRLMVTVETKEKSNVTLFNLGIFFIVILVSILTGIVSYRFYVYLKRRRYRADEFELVVD